MLPRLFEIPVFGGIPINTYGLAIMIGFLLATWIGVRRGEKVGINKDLILDIGILSMIFGILGAKINYVLQYPSQSASTGKSIFDLTDGGLHPLGTLLGALPYLFWWNRTRKQPKVPLFHWKNGVLLVVVVLTAIIGARALYLIRQGDGYDFKVWKDWQSGFVLYGGLVSAIAAGMVYTRLRGESVRKMADLAGPSILIGIAFGRIGCFLNGCCFGRVCELPWGVKYPQFPIPGDETTRSPVFLFHQEMNRVKASDTHSQAVHPTQLYEALAALLFFFILSKLWKRQQGTGRVFALTCGLYSAWRFALEFMREDPGREAGGVGSFTYSQTVSMIVFAGSLIWFFIARPSVSATPGEPPSQPAPEPSDRAGNAS